MWSSTRGKLTHSLKPLFKADGYLQRHNVGVMAANLTSFSDALNHRTESIDTAVNTVRMQIESLVDDSKSILIEVHREVQGLHSKMDDALVQKLPAIGRSIANQKVNLDKSLALFFQQDSINT
jgi:hypothetical protein